MNLTSSPLLLVCAVAALALPATATAATSSVTVPADGAAFAYDTGASDTGVESTYLLAATPGERGRVFSTADAVSETDPTTGPDPSDTRTGLTVDGTSAFLGSGWQNVVTPALQFVFGSYAPF